MAEINVNTETARELLDELGIAWEEHPEAVEDVASALRAAERRGLERARGVVVSIVADHAARVAALYAIDALIAEAASDG